MQEHIERIRADIAAGIEKVKDGTRQELFELKMKYLGKTGEISALSKGMRDVPAEQRPAMGKLVSEVRAWAEEQFDQTEALLKKKELEARYKSERIDVTMPTRALRLRVCPSRGAVRRARRACLSTGRKFRPSCRGTSF